MTKHYDEMRAIRIYHTRLLNKERAPGKSRYNKKQH